MSAAWVVVLLGVMLRLAGITRPLLGNFGDYQAGMAMIARHFAEGHFTTILYPQTYDLVNGQPSLVLLFYPLSSLLAAALHVLSGLSLDFLGRLQSVVFFAGAALLLYRLVARISGRPVALAALIAFSLSPLTIVYGQSFLNDMGAVFFILLFFMPRSAFSQGSIPLIFSRRRLLSLACFSCGRMLCILSCRPFGWGGSTLSRWLRFGRRDVCCRRFGMFMSGASRRRPPIFT